MKCYWTWSLLLQQMIPVLWWRIHRGNPRRCGSSYPGWLRSPPVQLCQGCQSVPPLRPAPLSSCNCLLWWAHSLRQTARERNGVYLNNCGQRSHPLCPQRETFLPWELVNFTWLLWCELLTSSYMNWRVRADFPTPPLPTIITLWRAREFCPFGLAAAMARCTKRSEWKGGESSTWSWRWREGLWNEDRKNQSEVSSCNQKLNDNFWGGGGKKREKKS